MRPNNSFKPYLLRFTGNVAGKACHVVGSATQVGLTQALERTAATRRSGGMDMSVSEAQVDMRQGYCSAGAGILASTVAWSIAAGIAVSGSAHNAVWALLI